MSKIHDDSVAQRNALVTLVQMGLEFEWKNSDRIDNEDAQRNFILSLVEKGQWDRIERIATNGTFGFEAAKEALVVRENAVARHRAATFRSVFRRRGPVDLKGPAVAGKRGGGREAPPVKQPELGSKEAIKIGLGVKTNVPGQGPPKGPSGCNVVKTTDLDKRGGKNNKGKGKNKDKDGKKKGKGRKG